MTVNNVQRLMTRRLPPHSRWIVPDTTISEVSEPVLAGGPGFLQLVRRELQITYPNGKKSRSFAYDEVSRNALDAVVIVAYFFREQQLWVYLRSATRPPLAFRRCSFADPLGTGAAWELPAGLIEADELGAQGVLCAAARELREELGFEAPPESFQWLGAAVLPCPAMLAEQQFFVRLAVNPDTRAAPSLDGSPLEEYGKIIALPLEDAIAECRTGIISDSKTEIGLRRLQDDSQKGIL